MVENSLGRYWLDHHPDSTLEASWAYYVAPRHKSGVYDISPESIKVIDEAVA
jgi:hypothetical protein